MRHSWAFASAFVLAVSGCTSTRDVSSASRVICVAEHITVGSRIRLNAPGGWVEPEPFVVTSLHGKTRHCTQSPARPMTARAVPLSMWQAVGTAKPPTKTIKELATVGSGDVVPAGRLHVATQTWRKIRENESAAWLVVNFDRANDKGELSYVADATVECATGALTVMWWTTFRQADGEGEAVNSASPAQKIDKPSAAVGTFVKSICEMG